MRPILPLTSMKASPANIVSFHTTGKKFSANIVSFDTTGKKFLASIVSFNTPRNEFLTNSVCLWKARFRFGGRFRNLAHGRARGISDRHVS